MGLNSGRKLALKNMAEKYDILTTICGNLVGDNQNSATAGLCGPLWMQDYQLLEKFVRRNCGRIPERTVPAKDTAASGALTITRDIAKYWKAVSR
jgi:catalase